MVMGPFAGPLFPEGRRALVEDSSVPPLQVISICPPTKPMLKVGGAATGVVMP